MNASQILVVDDESDIRGLLQEILTEEGYDVSVAADASEARTWWQKADPDLVLLDCTVCTMPEEGGGFHNVSGRPDYDLGHIPTAGFAVLP